ncbi:hypothetical protein LTR36_007612 [Oleoguttula mirabilis]|uniref:Uncharacterized protein n=1 Tax=Oleoguttula mirabilis TaxID=1507867 RepID=A0AAV9JUB6_9PEZI|nr:hypothetical protein LTR36_007612 [Oleoguttula mirabilis]
MKNVLAAAALALPAFAHAASTGFQQQQATFDDITVTVPVASLQAIDTYQYLLWTGFDVIDVSLAPTGVAPQSEPNVAVQYLLTTGTSNTASLTPATGVSYFALQSFYFGCVASSQETAAGLPIACSLTLTGKRGGETIATQEVSFDPSELALTSNMTKVVFAGSFQAVDEVTFEQTAVLATAISVMYDEVSYATFAA